MGKFKELRVWQESLELATIVYGITKKGPFSKDFGLANQIQRAVVSISSNIAEGDERRTNKESVHYFSIAVGSAAETITQLNIAHRIGYIDTQTLDHLEDQAGKIAASLKRLINARLAK